MVSMVYASWLTHNRFIQEEVDEINKQAADIDRRLFPAFRRLLRLPFPRLEFLGIERRDLFEMLRVRAA